MFTALRVKFVLKTVGGYPNDVGVTTPWQTLEISFVKTPLSQITTLRPLHCRGTGRAASGGVLVPEPPLATRSQPETIRVFRITTFLPFLLSPFFDFGLTGSIRIVASKSNGASSN